MSRKFVLSTAAIAMLSTSAFAADLPPRAAPPVYIPPPAFAWSGVYLGATAGFAEGFHTFNDLNDAFFGYSGLGTRKAVVLLAEARLASTFKQEIWFTVSKPI